MSSNRNCLLGIGDHLTRDILVAVQIEWKICMTVIQLLAMRLIEMFAHAWTYHVHNFIAITLLQSEGERKEFSIQFEFGLQKMSTKWVPGWEWLHHFTSKWILTGFVTIVDNVTPHTDKTKYLHWSPSAFYQYRCLYQEVTPLIHGTYCDWIYVKHSRFQHAVRNDRCYIRTHCWHLHHLCTYKCGDIKSMG